MGYFHINLLDPTVVVSRQIHMDAKEQIQSKLHICTWS